MAYIKTEGRFRIQPCHYSFFSFLFFKKGKIIEMQSEVEPGYLKALHSIHIFIQQQQLKMEDSE